MKLRDLMQELQKHDPELEVDVWVSWASDTACSDEGEDVEVSVKEGRLVLRGWMSDCATELEFEPEG